MKISYSILTHNETDPLLKLIEFIVKHKDKEDDVCLICYSDDENVSFCNIEK